MVEMDWRRWNDSKHQKDNREGEERERGNGKSKSNMNNKQYSVKIVGKKW